MQDIKIIYKQKQCQKNNVLGKEKISTFTYHAKSKFHETNKELYIAA